MPQLFYNGRMMVEARWPNIDVNNVGDASMAKAAWRKVGDNTTYGTVHDPALRTNFMDGALATLNVAHQWNTWTRSSPTTAAVPAPSTTRRTCRPRGLRS